MRLLMKAVMEKGLRQREIGYEKRGYLFYLDSVGADTPLQFSEIIFQIKNSG